jgi:hypothetical protein
VPVSGDAEREVSHARRQITRRAEGDRNGNYKHGCFTKEAIEERCEVSAWAKLMRKLAEKVK